MSLYMRPVINITKFQTDDITCTSAQNQPETLDYAGAVTVFRSIRARAADPRVTKILEVKE